MQTSFIHYRLDEDGIAWRNHRGKNMFKPAERGGLTVCILKDDESRVVSWGVAECSRKDAFCYATGRKIAEGRARFFWKHGKVDYEMGENSPFRYIYNTIKNDMLEAV